MRDMTLRETALDAMRNDIGVVRLSPGWFTVDQALIDSFVSISAETGWIHTDPERARTDSPLGGTIAPGNLAIALMPRVSGPDSAYLRYPRKYSLNQGWDRIRFLQPLPAGSRIRAGSRLLAVDEKSDASLRVEVEFWMEMEKQDTPWVTAVKVGRFFYE